MRRIAIALVLALSATAAAQLVSIEAAGAADVTSITGNLSSTSVVYGTHVTINGGTVVGDGSGTAPTGSVTVTVDGVPLAPVVLGADAGDPTNTTDYGFIDLGVLDVAGSPHSVAVTYNPDGDSAYGAAGPTPIGSVTVTQQTPGLNATPSNANPTLGTAINVGIDLTGANPLTGALTVKEGVTPLAPNITVNGAGHYTSGNFTFATGGAHTITVAYLGDTNHKTATDSATVNVALPTTTIAFTSATSVNYGQNYTLTGTVTSGAGTPGGSITLSGGVTGTVPLDANGGFSVALTIAQLAVGGHTITGTYTANGNFAGATKSFTLTVNKASVDVVVSGPTQAFPGLPTALTVTVTPHTAPTLQGALLPSGTVNATGTDGPKIIAGNGSASLTASAITATKTYVVAFTPAQTSPYATGSGQKTVTFTRYALDLAVKDSSGCGSPGPACASVPPGFPMPLTVVLTPSAGQPVPPAGMVPTGTVVFHDTLNTAFWTPQTAALSGSGVASTFGQFPTPGSDNVFATYAGNANFAASNNTAAPLQVGVPNTDHNTRYVYWVYNDLLGRSPDAGGVSYWASLLNSGVPRPTVAWALVNSNEYRGDVLGSMYQQFLGRSIDATGLAYWTNQVAGGMTFEQFQSLLIGSDEYFLSGAKGKGNNSDFVKSMYQDILGRSVDPTGLAFFKGQLDAGTLRQLVVSAIVFSGEHLASTVDGYYEHFLSRGVDASGQSYWVNQLQHGSRDELIVALIIGSDEYFSLV